MSKRHRCQKCNGICERLSSYNSKTGARSKFWECRDCKNEEPILPKKRKVPVTVDDIIALLEARKLGWSLDHTGCMIEARIWNWPTVVGRYRPTKVEPLAHMLLEAAKQGGLDLPLHKETT